MAEADKGISTDNIKGLVLALSSSFFIGASFIVKKKGLKKAGASGLRAGQSCGITSEVKDMYSLTLLVYILERIAVFLLDIGVHSFEKAEEKCAGGYAYIYEPLWWIGMITMIVGEIANFAAYAFAPAILVTPLGALSIIIRQGNIHLRLSYIGLFYNANAALAHVMLQEKLHIFGILGCVLCVVGSTTIVLHAPQEREIESVKEVWDLATEPAFLLYAAIVIAAVIVIIIHVIPYYGQTHVMVYISVCSLMGSLSVMSVKALGIALKLTFSGMNQLLYPQTWTFTLVVLACVITQINYLNKWEDNWTMASSYGWLLIDNFYDLFELQALDTFNTAVVSPIYYVMFTTLTILASVIMFKDWDGQNATQIVTEVCGFVTILSGTFLLHKTKDMIEGSSQSLSSRLPKHDEEDGVLDHEGVPLRRLDSLRPK
ncbi:hypothetical protein DKX38_020034 [Salix brachista]|uniref:Probable magnesium transporter n=2 Tax=Salix TaxID=40685 RepID=A0A5N5KHV3_9ROSI|nr:hypothetical protein DKX38_020034 [Salix brachista]